MSNAQIVRLTTGEELLCNIVSHDKFVVTVENPYVILPTQEGNIQFMKYMGYAVYDTLPIKVDNVMWVVEPNIELTTKHSEMTKSILIPKPKIVT